MIGRSAEMIEGLHVRDDQSRTRIIGIGGKPVNYTNFHKRN